MEIWCGVRMSAVASQHTLRMAAITQDLNLLKYLMNFWFCLNRKLIAQSNTLSDKLNMNRQFANLIIMLKQMPGIAFLRFRKIKF